MTYPFPTRALRSLLAVFVLTLALFVASAVKPAVAEAATCSVALSAPSTVEAGHPLRIKVYTPRLSTQVTATWKKLYSTRAGNLWIMSGGVYQAANGWWVFKMTSGNLNYGGAYRLTVKAKYAGCDTKTFTRTFYVV